MRLFVAIPLPLDARLRLSALQSDFSSWARAAHPPAAPTFSPLKPAAAGDAPGPSDAPPAPSALASGPRGAVDPEGVLRLERIPWRLTPPHHMHLTLQFVGGSLNIHQAHDVERALEPVGARAAPFELSGYGVGAFPVPSRARVVWAGLREPTQPPSPPSRFGVFALADAVHAALAPLGFKPDTVFSPHLTLARHRTWADAAPWVKAHASDAWHPAPWRADRFILFESVRTLEGYEHHALREYPLNG